MLFVKFEIFCVFDHANGLWGFSFLMRDWIQALSSESVES